MTPPDPLLLPLAALLNRNLQASPRAGRLAERLEGRALRLVVATTPIELLCFVRDARVHLARGGAGDATITGTPLGLLALASRGGEDRPRGEGLRIEGDAETAQAFRDLLVELRPDVEEELSRHVGDALAHHLARSARGALDYATRAFRTLGADVAEYLTEESRDVPTRDEVATFASEVDRLRDATERLAARIALIERQRPAR